jgi:hypothetical protein
MTIIQLNATAGSVGKLFTAPLRLGFGLFRFAVRTVAHFYVGSFGLLLLLLVVVTLFRHLRIATQWLFHFH